MTLEKNGVTNRLTNYTAAFTGNGKTLGTARFPTNQKLYIYRIMEKKYKKQLYL